MNFKLWNNIIGWLMFIVASFTYLSTIEPTASFWDCGEFIATSYKYEVGHPPGAPFFMIITRFVSMFAPDKTLVAKFINGYSAIMSALTILFLFWTITYFAKRLIIKENEKITTGQAIAILGSGIIGALAYTFSDTFWFSAVEAEVYASSSMLTALVFWLVTKWDQNYNKIYAWRYLILIALVMGISIGVHLLNLLAIPAIVFVIYFRLMSQITKKNIIITSLISILILALIMYGIIQGIFKLSGNFELFFVNTLGLPFFSGLVVHILLLSAFFFLSLKEINKNIFNTRTFIYITLFVFLSGATYLFSGFLSALIIATIAGYILYRTKAFYSYLNIMLWSIAMIIIGYASFALILIRSNANTPIDENNPEDVFSLISYLNREQYGDRPLFYGQTFASPLDRTEPYIQSEPIYLKNKERGKYDIVGYKTKQNFAREFNMLFPRMYSQERNHVSAYKSWTNFKGTPVNWVHPDGTIEKIYKPTFLENLKFFFSYQLGWMYFRYFMWNFAGRQNDIQGHGNVMHGNWISGIPFIDNKRLGDQNLLPDYLKNNKARNKYYMLPLILGLIGLFYQYSKHTKDFVIVMLLFFFTGIAIVIYLNQTPYQPRERDYAYAGSFYAFAIWIGLGLAGIWDYICKNIKNVPITPIALTLTILLFFAVPYIMAKENWNDHDRSNRYTPRDFAYNYLQTCDTNAVLFTNGDNDTFPLWYAQEVEGIRTDVRVVNLSLLNTDWYMEQMKYRVYESDPLPISFKLDEISGEKRVYCPILERFKTAYPVKDIISLVRSNDPAVQIQVATGEMINFIPTRYFRHKVDSAAVINSGTLNPKYAKYMVKELNWRVSKSYLTRAELGILDIMANTNWKRPLYFAITVGDAYVNLEKYFRVDGLAYRLTPVEASNLNNDMQTGWIDTDILYDRLMNRFKWGNIDKDGVYLDENNLRMISNFRNLFARLANALIKEGKKDSARKVLDKCMEVMPEKNIPFNFFILGIIEGYYKLGEIKKARKIHEKLIKITEQEINYFLGIPKSDAQTLTNEARRSMAIYNELQRIAKLYSQNDLDKQIEENQKLYLSKYFEYFPSQQQNQEESWFEEE